MGSPRCTVDQAGPAVVDREALRRNHCRTARFRGHLAQQQKGGEERKRQGDHPKPPASDAHRAGATASRCRDAPGGSSRIMAASSCGQAAGLAGAACITEDEHQPETTRVFLVIGPRTIRCILRQAQDARLGFRSGPIDSEAATSNGRRAGPRTLLAAGRRRRAPLQNSPRPSSGHRQPRRSGRHPSPACDTCLPAVIDVS